MIKLNNVFKTAFIVIMFTFFTNAVYAYRLEPHMSSYELKSKSISSFSLSTDKDKINLEWELNSVENIESLSIERSIDKRYFKPIQEFSNVYEQGFYSDFIPNIDQKASQIRYRLVIHYKNGEQVISQSKQVQLERVVQLKPTIISTLSQIEINFSSENEMNTEIQFFNTTGREVLKENFLAKKGGNLYLVDSSNFHKGLYFVRITQGGSITTTKFYVR